MMELVRMVRSASREMVRELGVVRPAYSSERIPPLQCHALIEIDSGVTSPAELAERLLIDRTAASRLLRMMGEKGWIRRSSDESDRRRQHLTLTQKGRRALARVDDQASRRVAGALETLGPERAREVAEAMTAYSRALRRTRLRERCSVRSIRKKDEAAMAGIIRTVMPEFGAKGEGFAINDPEVDHMWAAYRAPRHAYFVLERDGEIIGGGGVAPLAGGDEDVCELRKMYLLPQARGLGYGQEILDLALDSARSAGFRRCYLETLSGMDDAQRLYRRNGFDRIEGPMGRTGHFGCNTFYLRTL